MPEEMSWDELSQMKDSKTVKFKGKTDVVQRIHFMAPPIHDAVHYSTKLKTYWSARSKWHIEDGRLIIDKLGWDAIASETTPVSRWSMPVMVIETNKDGLLLTEDPAKIGFDFQIWSVAGATRKQMGSLVSRKVDLSLVDIYVTCEDENFQKCTLMPEVAGLMKNEVFAKRVVTAFNSWPQGKLTTVVGETTDEELAKKLGCSVPDNTADPSDQLD